MKIVCISDTHNQHEAFKIPDGDMLIHAGDFSSSGRLKELTNFNTWLGTLPHKYKIIIAGNHDFLFEREPNLAKSLITNAIYLEDSGIVLEGLKFWGSPVSPRFFNWAFNRSRGKEIKAHWDLIPSDTDVLITHGPPYNILDKVYSGEKVGCVDLYNKIKEVMPKVCIFGHIHEGYGSIVENRVTYINASSVNVRYKPVNEPIVIDL